MSWPRPILTAIILLASAAPIPAQDTQITISSNVSPEQIKEWLESSDSSSVIWGAWFASQSQDALNDDAYVTIMVRRMARWLAPPRRSNPLHDRDDLAHLSHDAMSEILDALIQRNEIVPAESIDAIASEFPSEAAILAARLPTDRASSLLLSWYDKRELPERSGAGARDRDPLESLQAIAAMLLAKAPPGGFAASVLAETSDQLIFRVVDPDEIDRRGGSAPGKCKVVVDEPIPDNAKQTLSRRPPMVKYWLTLDAPAPYGGPLVVDAAGMRITYWRTSVWTRATCMRFPSVLTDEVRHHIIGEMVGVDNKAIPWSARQEFNYPWDSKEGFLRALKAQIDQEEVALNATVDALYSKGYLTQDEAQTVRPSLAVQVLDSRDIRIENYISNQKVMNKILWPEPLPHLNFVDPHTSITYATGYNSVPHKPSRNL